MMKKVLLLLVVVFFAASCGKRYEEHYTRSFVLGYGNMHKIEVRPYFDNKLEFGVDFIGEGEWDIFVKGEKKAFYDALCEKHGDLTYNRRVRIEKFMFDCRCFRDFVELEVWSSADWDAEHPAGTLLNDLAVFVSNTPWPYIRSGYTRKYSEEKDGEYYPVERRISELTPDDMTLLPRKGFWFYFTAPPRTRGEHTLSVRLTADDGTVFTADCPVTY